MYVQDDRRKKKHNTKHPAPINTYVFDMFDAQLRGGKRWKRENFDFTDSLTFVQCFSVLGRFQWPARRFLSNKRHLADAPSTLLIFIVEVSLSSDTHTSEAGVPSLRLYYCWAPNVCWVFFSFSFCTQKYRLLLCVHMHAFDEEEKKVQKTLKFRLLPDSENENSSKQRPEEMQRDTTEEEHLIGNREKVEQGVSSASPRPSKREKFIELFLISLSFRCFYLFFSSQSLPHLSNLHRH